MYNMATGMKQLFQSMESTLKLQMRAKSERRAEEAQRDKKEFEEKLMRAAAGTAELEGLKSKAKGREDAVYRDQLIGFMR